jgi:hypothetical protein
MTKPRKSKKRKKPEEESSELVRSLDDIVGALLRVPRKKSKKMDIKH